MKPRFQADGDLKESIRTGTIRREPSIEFRSAREAALTGLRDSEVLRLAAVEHRIVVSHDENTMPTHFWKFVGDGGESPGLLIIPQDTPVRAVIESILLIWIASDAAEWTNRVQWLPL